MTIFMSKLALLTILHNAVEAAAEHSFGTLVRCGQGMKCLWADEKGQLVQSSVVAGQLVEREMMQLDSVDEARRRLEGHMQYMEDVYRLASARKLSLSYKLGVTARHLLRESSDRTKSASEFVEQEAQNQQKSLDVDGHDFGRRRLSSTLPSSINWCSEDNPLKRSVCTPIKSQNKCGSCWAFAATDTIEAAVSISQGSSPLALSPQQLLQCSRREMTATFHYCWVPEERAPSAPWLNSEMKWGSQNNGCDGGMAHGAFADVAQFDMSLLYELDLPYTESDTTESYYGSYSRKATCNASEERAAAKIEGWVQVVGRDCFQSSNPTELLKRALQQQPISVAINSGLHFKDYKGGIYTCPNNGDFPDSSHIDHAVVLVGYGSEDGVDYWIVRNSYGSQWGENGYLRLRMDSKLNCGLNVFPVVPLGARAGPADLIVDGGGKEIFVGLPISAWIAIGVAAAASTLVLTAVGVLFAKRRRRAMIQSS